MNFAAVATQNSKVSGMSSTNASADLVGMARCAVRAASSGATVPPAVSRAGTSRRNVPTKTTVDWQTHFYF